MAELTVVRWVSLKVGLRADRLVVATADMKALQSVASWVGRSVAMTVVRMVELTAFLWVELSVEMWAATTVETMAQR